MSQRTLKSFFNNIHETDEKLTSEAAVSFVGSRGESGIFWPLDDDQGNLLRGIDNCGTSAGRRPSHCLDLDLNDQKTRHNF